MKEVNKTVKWVLWIIWLAVFPSGLYFAYQVSPLQEFDWTIVISVVCLAVISAYLPFKVDHSTIFIIHWINLAAFLTYGLFFEMLLMQIVLVPLLFRARMTFKTLYRFPLNSTMFMLISLLAGLVFYQIGIDVSDGFWPLMLASGIYIFIHIFANHIYLYVFNWIIGNRYSFLSSDTKLDYAATMLSMPFGLALYYLLVLLGPAATLLLGIPFLAVTLILRLYNTAERVNIDLAKSAKIGHQLAERLNVNEVLDLFTNKLAELMPLDYTYVLDVHTNRDELVLLRRIENGQLEPNNLSPVRKGEGISGKVWETGDAMLFGKKTEWVEEVEGYIPADIESIICVPIQRDKKTVAVLLAASKKKNAFGTHLIAILEILCSYLAIAMQNARNYQRNIKRSERCALTGLYNFRYFNEQLEKEFSRLEKGHMNALSLILLDIDHFKKVNDTYGHESGNDLLKELAGVLIETAGGDALIARYGGEEFVLLLSEQTKEEAQMIGEKIRCAVENTIFEIQHDLSKKREMSKIQMTVSIGVASSPEDTDSYKNLLRNADRALYIGAKQKGRNKVAVYAK
ncbi:sensor domain-containing diguanylate cyclase [Jeotgalibacillus haloalkalitolerans]|uniref:Sensor domain-containing diguanylate cyclase n=1 Tax=Jeotgalibacillus haloalkalitolerans TaxID=3104292 RepID=A0ABU5KM85_9BACL|nr:sensor domain-containing diguanylate cyclase [Jeotgalibacillus sp. HH7-29]MDZ5712371.1 sensor domain-containing diguanylate cyclase [Jeotgalibacillus sp. HH7-29]